MDADTDVRASSAAPTATPATQAASPAQAAVPAPRPAPAADRLGAEVRESAVLLLLSMLVTVGLATGVQALLALLD